MKVNFNREDKVALRKEFQKRKHTELNEEQRETLKRLKTEGKEIQIDGKIEKLVVGRDAIDNCEDIKNLAPDLEDYVLLTPIKSVSYDKTKNTVTELILPPPPTTSTTPRAIFSKDTGIISIFCLLHSNSSSLKVNIQDYKNKYTIFILVIQYI